MMHDRERGAAARRRRHAVARENLHILGDHLGVVHERLDKRDAGDEAVDIVLGDTGVLERKFRRLDVKLGGAQMRHDTDFGVSRANDCDLVLQRFRGRAPQFIGKPNTRATLSWTILRVSASGISAKF